MDSSSFVQYPSEKLTSLHLWVLECEISPLVFRETWSRMVKVSLGVVPI